MKAMKITTIYVLSIIFATVVCLLPIEIVHFPGGESYTFTLKGHNLTEFSWLGWIPIISPLLMPAIFLTNQPKRARCLEVLILIAVSVVCFAFSLNATNQWIESVGGIVRETFF